VVPRQQTRLRPLSGLARQHQASVDLAGDGRALAGSRHLAGITDGPQDGRTVTVRAVTDYVIAAALPRQIDRGARPRLAEQHHREDTDR
jgi:hypothetical protein